jgi:dTDP-glucose pyrophosphorylase
MAGKNTRFHDLGIDIPKYLLPVNGAPIIDAIISNLLNSNNISNVYLVAHIRDRSFRAQLEKSLIKFNIDVRNLYYIGETSGQAESAYLGAELIHHGVDRPILFHNADTILVNRNLKSVKSSILNGVGSIDVFRSDLQQYSYVKTSAEKVIQISEKKVISSLATSGLYAFDSSQQYREVFRNTYDVQFGSGKELYISDIISEMIKQGKVFHVNDESDTNEKSLTLVMGTPMEYNKIINKSGELFK